MDLLAFPEGMNQQAKPWAIPDSQARWLEDVLLDRENQITRRGPIKPMTGWPTSMTTKGIGLVQTDDPSYRWKVAVLHGTSSSSSMGILNTDYTSLNTVKWDEASPQTVFFDPTKRYKLATSVHPRGGALIGVQNFAGKQGQTSLGHWGGGTLDNSSGSSLTVAQDSTSVTGASSPAWLTTAEPGMFLYATCDVATGSGKNYIGQVKSVESNTALTLVEGSLFAVTARGWSIRAVRPLDRRVAKGTITVNASGDTPKILSGALTKFKRQGLGSGVWTVFRADDMKYIGKVDTVESDIQLHLVGDALVSCNKDEYIAINMVGDLLKKTVDAGDFGWITGQFAGRCWYANNPYSNKSQPFSAARVWFSDIFDPEALDHTSDGDHILIPSTKPPIKPITAMVGLPTCLAVFKEDEVYGIFGTDESNFSLRKIDCPDGALNPMVLQRYQDGVVFAGAHGIWFFDGNECFDITEDRMQDWYEKAMEGAQSRTYGAWSMLYKNTYFLYADKATPPTGPDRSDNQTNAEGGTTADHLALAIDLNRRAFSTLTNFSFQGAVMSPDEENQGTIFLVNKHADSTPWALTGARFCAASDLFYSDGLDTITTDLRNKSATQLGPDLFIESKRYDMAEPQLKKRIKQLQMQYRLDTVSGDFITLGLTGAGQTDYDANYLKFATMVGFNELATVSGGKWHPTRASNGTGTWKAAFQNKKLKFNKRSTHLGFKIWQVNKTGIKSVRIGPMALGYKKMRPGRV